MNSRKQCESFYDDLIALCNRYRDEYDLKVYEVVGILHSQAFQIEYEAYSGDEECDEDEDDDLPSIECEDDPFEDDE